MTTLLDLGHAAEQIRTAIDSLELKGRANASLVVYACSKCDEIIATINEVAAKIDNPPEAQNGEPEQQEEVEMNGEPDSGTAS